jgi:hypothetical protein
MITWLLWFAYECYHITYTFSDRVLYIDLNHKEVSVFVKRIEPIFLGLQEDSENIITESFLELEDDHENILRF